MITKDTPNINVAQLIYEFILLAIPAKKIHPDYWMKLMRMILKKKVH